MSYSLLKLKLTGSYKIDINNMDFSKSKLLLKKINAIHDSVNAFGTGFSQLEKDLILQYLRELYECINLEGVHAPPAPQVKAAPETTPSIETPVVRSTPQPIVPPIITSNVSTTSSNGSSNGTTTYVEPPVEKSKKVKLDPELDKLFEESNSNDLSQRFANAPIKDIAKAMGINERILTINDLFKGDQQSFQSTADALNACANFEEAKAYLINGIATKNEWFSNKRKKKAAVFIKLVRRRYL